MGDNRRKGQMEGTSRGITIGHMWRREWRRFVALDQSVSRNIGNMVIAMSSLLHTLAMRDPFVFCTLWSCSSKCDVRERTVAPKLTII